MTVKLAKLTERILTRVSPGTYADLVRLRGEHMKKTGKKVSQEEFIENEIFIPFIKSKTKTNG